MHHDFENFFLHFDVRLKHFDSSNESAEKSHVLFSTNEERDVFVFELFVCHHSTFENENNFLRFVDFFVDLIDDLARDLIFQILNDFFVQMFHHEVQIASN